MNLPSAYNELTPSKILLQNEDILVLVNRVCAKKKKLVISWGKNMKSLPEIKDPVCAKTSPKRSFSMTEYERIGLVFMKTRVYI